MAQSKKAKKVQIELKKKNGNGISSKKLDLSNVMGYNVKARKMERIQGAKIVTTKNHRKAVKGHGEDGTTIMKFIKNN